MIPLALGAVGLLPASGATITWNGAGPDNNWSSSANWGGSVAANGDALIFSGAARPVNANDILTAIGAVTFSNGGFNVSGNALTVNGDFSSTGNNTWGINSTLGGARLFTSNSGTLTLAGSISNGNHLLTVTGAGDTVIAGVVGGGSGGITKTGAGVLTLSGANTYTGATRISGGTISITSDANLGAVPLTATPSSIVIDSGILSTTGTFTLHSNRGIAIGPTSGQGNGTINVVSGELTYGGIITSNTTSGTGNLVKTGSGILTLSGANTYSGNTVISAGTLKLGSSSAIPSGVSKGDVVVTGTLDLNGNSATVNGLSGSGLITSGQVGFVNLTAGSNNRSGTFSGVIQNGAGTIGLTKTGTGTLTLGGNNTFTGGVVINGGALQLAGAGALNSSSPNSITFGAGAAVGTKLQLNGNSVTIGGLATHAVPGTVVLENASVTASTLTVNQSASSTFAGVIQNGTGGGALSLVKTGSGTLTLSGTNTYTGNTTISGGTLQAGSALATPSGSGTGNFILDGNASAANVGILDINGYDISINGLSGTTGANVGRVVNNKAGTTKTITIGSGDASTTFAGLIVNNTGTGGTLNLTKTGTGILTLTNANTYGGSTTIRNGTITAGILNALPTSTLLTLGDGTANTSGVLRLNGFSQTVAGLTNLGSGNGNRIVNGSATGVTLTLNTAANSSFGGILGGSGTNENNFNLVKTGAGIMTLSGANTYTGTTTITQGTLSVGNLSNGLGSASSLVVLGDASNTGTLSYTGNSTTFARGFTVTAGGGQIDTTSSGQTLTIATGNVGTSGAFTVGGSGNTSITSAVTGTGSLNKTGSGNLILSGVNTYSGATNIRNGSIILGVNDTGLRSSTTVTLGDATLNTNGVLRLDGYTQTLAGLLKTGNGTGNRVIGGSTTLSVLTLNHSGANVYGGILGGSGTNENNLALVKTGAGVLTLSGTNTYTGGTTISAGTISISAANNLGNNSGILNIGAGTLQITSSLSSGRTINLTDAASVISIGSGVTYTHSGVVSGTGALNVTGGGNLLLSGTSNAYSGGTRIQNGTITLGAANGLPSGSALVLGNGTTSGRLALNGFSQTLSSLSTSGTGNGNSIVNGRVGAATLTIDNSANTTFTGLLGGTGTNENNFGLTKSGTGTLTISGANTYTGDTIISAGTLQLGAGTAIPSGTGRGNVNIGTSGTLDLNARTTTVNGLTGSGLVTSSAAGSVTFNAGGNDQNTTFSGVIQNGSGTVGFTKVGAGVLTLSGTNTYSGTTTVTLGTLRLGSATAIPYGSGKGNVSLTGTLDLAGYGIAINGLSGSGGISSSVAGAVAISVGANDQTSSYGGVISNGTGTVGLTKVGTGTLTLTGVSTYSGATLVKNGTLALGTGNDRLPTGTILTLGDSVTNDSGVFSLSGRNQSLAGLLVTGTGTSNRVVGGSGTVSQLTITNAVANDFKGILGGAGANENNLSLVKSGAGVLTLSGNNTFTGGVTIASGGTIQIGHLGAFNSSAPNALSMAGRLQLNGYSITIGNLSSTSGSAVIENANATQAALTVNGTSNTSYAGTIVDGTGGGALSLVKVGAGTLTLSGTNTFTGGTTIQEGTISIGADTHIGGIPSTPTAANIVLNGGTLLTTGTNMVLNANRGIALGPSSGSGTGTISVASGTTLTYSGIIANNGGTGGLVKTNSGILTLGGTANSYTGGTSITGGLINVTATSGTPLGADVTGNNIDIAAGGNLSISSTSNKGGNQIITVNSNSSGKGGIGISNTGITQSLLTGMFVDSTGTDGGVLSINNGINYNSAINLANLGQGTWFLGSAGTGTFSGGAANLTVGTGNLYRLGGGGGTITFNALNVLTGANGVQVGFAGANGGGQVTISNSQNYTGTTSILGGILSVSADNRLGTVPTNATAGNIVINGGTLSASGGFSLDSRRGIALGPASGSGTGTINVAAGTLAYSGIIANNGSGTGGLTKTGTGTLALSGGQNSYTGATNLNGGVTSFTSINDLGQGTAIGFNGGTLQWAAGNTTDITTRTVTTTSTGGATLDVGANNVSLASSAITGTGSLTKLGTGTLTLGIANGYTGATTITAGTLRLGAAGAIPTSSVLTLNSSAVASPVLDLNGFDASVGNLAGNSTQAFLGRIVNSAEGTNGVLNVSSAAATSFSGVIADNNGTGGTISLVKTGTSTLTLAGANNYSGGTTISAGGISISSDGNLGAVPTTAQTSNIILTSGASLITSVTMTLNENRGIGIGPSGTTAAILAPAAGTILSYDGVISNIGTSTGGLTKSNTTGVLILGGANTYAGDTTISGGTLRVANEEAIPSGTGKGNVSVAGVLDLNGNLITVNGLTGSGGVTSSVAGNAGIIVGDNNQTSTFNGIISNGAGVVSVGKIGSGTLTLSGNNSYTGGTTISGGVLSVASDANLGAVPGVATAGNIVINGGTLSTSATAVLSSARGIAVGPESGSGTGIISAAAGTTLTYGGVIANNGGGTGGLTKANTTGTLFLSGANTYSGDTTVLGGTLRIGNVAAIPSGSGKGNLSLGSGSTLELNNLSPTVNGLSGTGTVTNNMIGAVTFTAGGNDAGGTFGGIIQDGNGTVSFTKTGSGTLVLSGVSTYSGNTTVNSGTLQLGVASALPSGLGKGNVALNGYLDLAGFSTTVNGLSGSGTVINSSTTPATLTACAADQTSTFSGNIQNGAGSVALTKTGTGILTLSGNNTFSGATTISAGTLAIGSATGLSGNSTLTISAAGTLDVNGFNVTMDGLLGTGTISNSGTAAILTAGAGGTSSQFDGVIVDGSGAGNTISLNKSGAGTLTLTGINTYSGTTTISNGTVSVANPGAGGNLGTSSSAITLGDSSNKGTLSYTGNTDLTYTRGFDVKAGGGQMNITTAGRTLTLQGGNITTTGTFAVGGAGNAVLNSVISGTGGFTKANTGTLVMNSINTYSGDTTISSGTLQVTNAAAIPSGTGKGNVIANGTLDVGNLSLVLNGLSGSGVVTNSLGSPTSLTLGDNDASGNFSGVIQDGNGTMSVVKTGTGVLQLSGANTYSGDTTISSGTVRIGNAAAIASGPNKGNVSLAGAGTLDLNDQDMTVNGLSGSGLVTNHSGTSVLTVGGNDQSSTFSGNIQNGSGTIGFTKTGAGTLVLSGNNTFSGATSINGGVVTLGSDTALSAASTLNIGNAGTLDLNGRVIAIDGLAGTGSLTNNGSSDVMLTTGASGGSGTFGGTINDGTAKIALTKTGAGTVTLTNANNYSGGTTVTGGTLAITADNVLGALPEGISVSNIVLNGGSLSANNTFVLSSNRGIVVGPSAAGAIGYGGLDVATNQTLTYNGIIANNGAGTGGLNKTGSGTLTLGNANAYTGDTVVSGGTIQIANAAAIPAGIGKGNVDLNGAIDLNNFNITVNGLSGSGTVTNTKTGLHSITIGAADQSSTFSGVIENGNGTVSIAKTGTGTLTLSGANTFTGGTSNNSGVLALNSYGALGDTGTISMNGGTLRFSSSNQRDYSPRIVMEDGKAARFDTNGQHVTFSTAIPTASGGTGSLVKMGAGTLTITGNNTYGGGTHVTGGVLELGNGISNGSVAGNILNEGNVTFNNGASQTFSGAITGTGSLTKTGNGVLNMAQTSSYTGTTLVSAGTLLVNGALGETETFVAQGSTLGGTGYVGGNVASNGTIAPGNLDSIGSLGMNSLDLADTMLVQWNGNTDTIDQLNITNLLRLRDTSQVNFSTLGGTLTQSAYVFATYGTLDAIFNSFQTVNNLPQGYYIDYKYGEQANQIALVAIPEPGSIAMAVVGATLLFRRRRSKTGDTAA